MKIKIELNDVGCQKPGCKRRFSTPNRHHMRHEKRWINFWGMNPVPGWKWGKEVSNGGTYLAMLRARYYQFRSRDLVRLCIFHHAEIHIIYERIYRSAEAKFKLPWKAFGWREAIYVMRECKIYCKKWMQHPSPGVSPRRAGWK